MTDAGFQATKGGVDWNGKMGFRSIFGGNAAGADYEHWQDAIPRHSPFTFNPTLLATQAPSSAHQRLSTRS